MEEPEPSKTSKVAFSSVAPAAMEMLSLSFLLISKVTVSAREKGILHGKSGIFRDDGIPCGFMAMGL